VGHHSRMVGQHKTERWVNMEQNLHFICLLLPGSIHSQDFIKKSPFFIVDSFSRTIRYKHDLNRLTKELTDPYAEQLLKARAIFIWITDNIEYDYKFINNGRKVKIPDCEAGPFCE